MKRTLGANSIAHAESLEREARRVRKQSLEERKVAALERIADALEELNERAGR